MSAVRELEQGTGEGDRKMIRVGLDVIGSVCCKALVLLTFLPFLLLMAGSSLPLPRALWSQGSVSHKQAHT